MIAVCTAVAVLVLIRTIWSIAPTAYLLDSSELAASASALSISHPPGHPAFTSLSALGVAIPIGNAAMRVHLICGFFAACAAALLPLTAHRLGLLRDRWDLAASGLLALAVGLSDGFVFQSIRAEVYSLNAFLTVAALCVMARGLRDRDATTREVAVAATLLGVGLLNHHYLIVAAFPAFLLAILLGADRNRKRFRHIGVALIFGAIPLIGYAFVWARGLAQADASWVWPTDPGGLWWLVSAQAFQGTAANVVHVDPAAGIGSALGIMVEQLGPVGLCAAAVGFTLALVGRQRWTVVFAAAIAFNMATQIVFDFDPLNPDVLGYFMPSIAWIALFAGAAFWEVRRNLAVAELVSGVASVSGGDPDSGVGPDSGAGPVAGVEEGSVGSIRWGLASVIVASLSVAGAVFFHPISDRTRDLSNVWDSEVLRDAASTEIGPGGVFITAYYETLFNTWYGQAVEDRRPDVHLLHRSFRTYPHYDDMVRAMDPALAGLLDDDAQHGGFDLSAAAAWPGDVVIEADPTLRIDSADWRPRGLYLVLAQPGSGDSDDLASALLRWDRIYTQLGGTEMELQSRRNLLWNAYAMGTHFWAIGVAEANRAYLERALLLAPNDPDLQAMLGR